MTIIAKKIYDLNDRDNSTLTTKNLDDIAIQKDNDYNNEKTAWIFDDGSALVLSPLNDWEIVTNYGLHRDNEKL